MDIDFILNGGKPKKRKTSRDPLLDLFGSRPKQSQGGLMDLFIGQGHPRPGDRVTKSQRRVLKNKKNIFGDWDGDGVINGLDCQPRNPKKHGAQIRREIQNRINITDTRHPSDRHKDNSPTPLTNFTRKEVIRKLERNPVLRNEMYRKGINKITIKERGNPYEHGSYNYESGNEIELRANPQPVFSAGDMLYFAKEGYKSPTMNFKKVPKKLVKATTKAYMIGDNTSSNLTTEEKQIVNKTSRRARLLASIGRLASYPDSEETLTHEMGHVRQQHEGKFKNSDKFTQEEYAELEYDVENRTILPSRKHLLENNKPRYLDPLQEVRDTIDED